ncbi:MAG: hypothetical protein JWN95_30 [Frankiales bacterium]|nr:hypothetical protein [Frankiales bacterium]
MLVWLVGGYFVVVHPKLNQPTHADAIVVLGSVHQNGRLPLGFELANGGLADNLVLSVGASDVAAMNRDSCHRSIAHVTITCFTPDPATTRGEAEMVRRLAAEHGWTKVIVITSTYHISRARYIVGRCFDGAVEMVAAKHGIGLRTWAYQYVYQSVGYLKAFTQSGC